MGQFDNFFSSIFTDIKDILESNYSSDFEDIVIGPYQINELDYPCIHIIPERSAYQGRSEYQTSVDIFFYFERDAKDYSFLDNQNTVESTLSDLIIELDSNPNLTEFKISELEYFAGQAGQVLLNIIRVNIQCSGLIEYADF